ncbi:MAG: hypothetical protein AAB571_01225 [Chloroflexota bacterium]
MILNDIVQDIYTLEDEMRIYERKYGVLSETFYQSYAAGEEPLDESWVRDWTAWASAYTLHTKRRKQYNVAVKEMRATMQSMIDVIAQTARHDPIRVSA